MRRKKGTGKMEKEEKKREKSPFVSVVIVTYNGASYIEKCLTSVGSQKYPKMCFNIIVVDNASRDATGEIIKKKFPNVILLENSDNLGFGCANNQGIKKAQEIREPDYVALLNQDSWVEDDWLMELVNVLEYHPNAGCCGASEHLYESITAFSGKELNSLEAGTWMGCGTILLRKKTLDEVGLFDDIFFMYGEDMDLTWRINLAGWKILMNKRARWHHKGKERVTEAGDWRVFFSLRNRIFLLVKFGSKKQIIKSLYKYVLYFLHNQHMNAKHTGELGTKQMPEEREQEQKQTMYSLFHSFSLFLVFLRKCLFYSKIMGSVVLHLPDVIKRRRILRKTGVLYDKTDKWIQETDLQLYGI